MARPKTPTNGRLEEAMAILLQNQAALVQQHTSFLTRCSETDKQLAEMGRINAERFARIEQRFARIETLLLDHGRILLDHGRILEALPDAIRQKIGFKVPEQPAPA